MGAKKYQTHPLLDKFSDTYHTRLQELIDLIGVEKQGLPDDYGTALARINEWADLGWDDTKLRMKVMVAQVLNNVKRFSGDPHMDPSVSGNSGEHPIFAALLGIEFLDRAEYPDTAESRAFRRDVISGILLHDDGESLMEFGTVSKLAQGKGLKDIPETERRVFEYVYSLAAYALQEGKPAILSSLMLAQQMHLNFLSQMADYTEKAASGELTQEEALREIRVLNSDYDMYVQSRYSPPYARHNEAAMRMQFARHMETANAAVRGGTKADIDLRAEMEWLMDQNPIPGDLNATYQQYVIEMVGDYERAEMVDGPNLAGLVCKKTENQEGSFRLATFKGARNTVAFTQTTSSSINGRLTYNEKPIGQLSAAVKELPHGAFKEASGRLARDLKVTAYETAIDMLVNGPKMIHRKAKPGDEGMEGAPDREAIVTRHTRAHNMARPRRVDEHGHSMGIMPRRELAQRPGAAAWIGPHESRLHMIAVYENAIAQNYDPQPGEILALNDNLDPRLIPTEPEQLIAIAERYPELGLVRAASR